MHPSKSAASFAFRAPAFDSSHVSTSGSRHLNDAIEAAPTRRLILGGIACAMVADRAAAESPPDWDVLALNAAELVRNEYFDAGIAARLADGIEAKAKAGRYHVADRQAFSALLTEDLVAPSKDPHFQVVFIESAPEVVDVSRPPAPPSPGGPSAAQLESLTADNYGLLAAERLPGNVGLLAISWFPSPQPKLTARYGVAMDFLSDTSALVIDLTQTRGGSPATVAHLASYLFDRAPFTLNTLVPRHAPIDEFRTTQQLSGPAYGERRPVFVAVSHQTFSAGEEFAYDLQSFGRAKIVGQATLGGANPGPLMPIGGRLTVRIPIAAARNPVTRTNWEQVGVKPEIVAPVGQSRSVAHRSALSQLVATGEPVVADRARRALAWLDSPPVSPLSNRPVPAVP